MTSKLNPRIPLLLVRLKKRRPLHDIPQLPPSRRLKPKNHPINTIKQKSWPQPCVDPASHRPQNDQQCLVSNHHIYKHRCRYWKTQRNRTSSCYPCYPSERAGAWKQPPFWRPAGFPWVSVAGWGFRHDSTAHRPGWTHFCINGRVWACRCSATAPHRLHFVSCPSSHASPFPQTYHMHVSSQAIITKYDVIGDLNCQNRGYKMTPLIRKENTTICVRYSSRVLIFASTHEERIPTTLCLGMG